MKRHRRQYPGLRGRVVKSAESFLEGGEVYIAVHFTDETQLTFVLASQSPKIKTAELLKWKGGNSSVVRAYGVS
jgi:hypothetical protein